MTAKVTCFVRCAALTLGLCLALAANPASAQTGGGYDLSWNSLDAGASSSSGGGYELGATIGQADAGTMSGGAYTLRGGFWVPPVYAAYVPIVKRP